MPLRFEWLNRSQNPPKFLNPAGVKCTQSVFPQLNAFISFQILRINMKESTIVILRRTLYSRTFAAQDNSSGSGAEAIGHREKQHLCSQKYDITPNSFCKCKIAGAKRISKKNL